MVPWVQMVILTKLPVLKRAKQITMTMKSRMKRRNKNKGLNKIKKVTSVMEV